MRQRYRNPTHDRRREGPAGHAFTLGPPWLGPSHKTSDNPILKGVMGGAPDPDAFRWYMTHRARIGHIPTLLKDWVTAHPKYRAMALAQVKEWVEENRHLFKRG